jgi:membrane protease YdiL (CAAX protease family)
MLLRESPLLDGARRARRLPHGVVALIVAALIPFVASFLSVPLLVFVYRFAPAILENEIGTLMLSLLLAFSGIFFLLWLWVRAVERRPFATLYHYPANEVWGFSWQRVLFLYGRGFLSGVGLILLTLLLLWVLGVRISLQPSESPWTQRLLLVILVIPAWVVQGAAEEVLTRGWLLPVLTVRHGLGTGLFGSAMLFAALHVLNPGVTPLALLNLFLFGVFAAWYALREGSLWGICGCHSAWNWALGHLLGLSVSGASVGGSLLRLQLEGATSLTGGAFGPEGGWGVTLSLLLAWGVLLFLPSRAPRSAG